MLRDLQREALPQELNKSFSQNKDKLLNRLLVSCESQNSVKNRGLKK